MALSYKHDQALSTLPICNASKLNSLLHVLLHVLAFAGFRPSTNASERIEAEYNRRLANIK